jgi:hypothetical protein
MSLYGLSLSFCIRDILSGEIREEDVTAIVAATKLPTPEDAVDNYHPTYWRHYSREDVLALVQRMWPKIRQPRFDGVPGHNISRGCWIRKDGDLGSEYEHGTLYYV